MTPYNQLKLSLIRIKKITGREVDSLQEAQELWREYFTVSFKVRKKKLQKKMERLNLEMKQIYSIIEKEKQLSVKERRRMDDYLLKFINGNKK